MRTFASIAVLGVLATLSASHAHAQSVTEAVLGKWNMEWSDLHRPVSSDMPDLRVGTQVVDLVPPSGADCPPTSAFVMKPGGWCFLDDGTLDSSTGQYVGALMVYAPTNDGTFNVWHMEAEHGSRGADLFHAVGRRVVQQQQPPPAPPASAKVTITVPSTIRGSVQIKVATTLKGPYRYEIFLDDGPRDWYWSTAQNPIGQWWNSRTAGNGTHTLRARVTGSDGVDEARITVTVAN